MQDRRKPATELARHGSLERRAGGRAQWLRAAVLGADDGIVSSAGSTLGVHFAPGSAMGATALIGRLVGGVAL